MQAFVRTRRQLIDVGEGLIHEFDELPAGSVLRCVARCTRTLQVAGLDGTELPDAVEGMAREWLGRRFAA